jgi:hypothetical protein
MYVLSAPHPGDSVLQVAALFLLQLNGLEEGFEVSSRSFGNHAAG